MKTKTITYKTNNKEIEITVTNRGQIYHNGKELMQYPLARGGYMYCQVYNKETKSNVLINVARAIGMAFVPCKGDFADYQIDHIDGNTQHNCKSNLRWTTRKRNNSRKTANTKRRENAKHTSHKGQKIKATKGNEIQFYISGYAAALALCCSHVLIYNVLKDDYPAHSAKGWILQWVDENETEDGNEG